MKIFFGDLRRFPIIAEAQHFDADQLLELDFKILISFNFVIFGN